MKKNAVPFLITVVLTLSSIESAFSNTWNMRTFRIDWVMDSSECSNFITDLAGQVNDKMVAKGYRSGVLRGGNRSVVLDQIAGRDVSYYLYCSDFNVLIFTGHAANDGDAAFVDAYQEELNAFSRLREAYRH